MIARRTRAAATTSQLNLTRGGETASANLRVFGGNYRIVLQRALPPGLSELARLLRIRILTMGEPGEPCGTARIIICLATDYARGEGCVFALWSRLDASRRFRSA